jgi:hypothetical protein
LDGVAEGDGKFFGNRALQGKVPSLGSPLFLTPRWSDGGADYWCSRRCKVLNLWQLEFA